METTFVDPVTAAGQAAANAEPLTSTVLGRNDFLELLVAKLENQDPLKPSEDTEFVAELATFSSLEQLISANDQLEQIALSQSQLINAQTLTLIGKEALVESPGQLRIQDGRPDSLVYVMPRQASEATLRIVDSEGQTVKTFELETTTGGRRSLEWDGTDENGNALPDGDYDIEVTATDTEGEPMAIGLFQSLRIDGVSLVNGGLSLVSGGREIPFEMIFEIHAGQG